MQDLVNTLHICKPDLADEILYKLTDIAVCKFLLNRHVDQLYMQIGQFNIHILRVQKYFLDWHIAVFKIQQLIQYIRQDRKKLALVQLLLQELTERQRCRNLVRQNTHALHNTLLTGGLVSKEKCIKSFHLCLIYDHGIFYSEIQIKFVITFLYLIHGFSPCYILLQVKL